MSEIEEITENTHELIDDAKLLERYDNAMDKLYQILGPSILEKNHPSRWRIIRCSTENKIESLIDFADKIESYNGREDFNKEIKKYLAKKGQYYSKLFEFEIASWIEENGWDVEFIHRKPEDGSKTADILVEDKIPIELSQLNTPDHIKEQGRIYNEIQDALSKYHGSIERTGNLVRAITENEKEDIIEQIESEVERAKKGDIVEIKGGSLEDKTDYIFLLGPEKNDEYEKRRKELDLDHGLSGAPQSRNEIYRISQKIDCKVDKFDLDNPGVLLLDASLHTFAENKKDDLKDILWNLQEYVYDNEQICSLVVKRGSMLAGSESVNLEKGNFRVFETEGGFDSPRNSFLIVHNKFVDDKQKKDTIDEIFRELVRNPKE